MRKTAFSGTIGGMKKIFLSILCGLFLATGINVAFAQSDTSNLLPLDGTNYDKVMTDDNILHEIITIQDGKSDTVESLTKTESSLGEIFRNESFIWRINMVLGAIAILFLAILGLKFVVSQGDEDHMTKYKTQFGYIIMGLAIISVAEFVAFDFLDPSVVSLNGTGVLDNTALTDGFYNKIGQIKLFIEILVVGVVLIKMLMSGYDLIVRSEEDEAISKEKTFFRSFLFGTILILLAEVIARILSGSKTTGNDGAIDLESIGTEVSEGTKTGISEIVGLIDFSLSFLAVMSVIMLILASTYYVMSFGNEEQMGRAKRIVVSCVIGAIVAVSSFTIARFVIG